MKASKIQLDSFEDNYGTALPIEFDATVGDFQPGHPSKKGRMQVYAMGVENDDFYGCALARKISGGYDCHVWIGSTYGGFQREFTFTVREENFEVQQVWFKCEKGGKGFKFDVFVGNASLIVKVAELVTDIHMNIYPADCKVRNSRNGQMKPFKKEKMGILV